MDEYTKANLANWNERVAVHYGDRGELYDVAGFLAGGSTLRSIETEALGDVAGLDLLHLMCHFGLDTLSWARLGAKATGVDFSDAAVDTARELSRESGVEADFVRADVGDLPDDLAGRFDVVVATYGILAWLRGVGAFAAAAAKCLKPGGRLLLVDLHPVAYALEYDEATDRFEIDDAYFARPEPAACDAPTSYTNREVEVENTRTWQWSHSLGEVVGAFIGAGLRLEKLEEFPHLFFNRYPALLEKRGENWVFRDGRTDLPMTFSLLAAKG